MDTFGPLAPALGLEQPDDPDALVLIKRFHYYRSFAPLDIPPTGVVVDHVRPPVVQLLPGPVRRSATEERPEERPSTCAERW